MYLFGIISGVLLIFAYLASASLAGEVLGNALAPAWEAMSWIFPPHALIRGVPWWEALGTFLLRDFSPSFVLYWVLKLAVVCDWLEAWPRWVRLAYCWASQALFVSVAESAASGRTEPDWLFPLAFTLWVFPACIFWAKFSRREKMRTRPPRRVGDMRDDNWRFGLWRGLRTPFVKIGGFVFERGWKEPKSQDVFGRSTSATSEEAGLL